MGRPDSDPLPLDVALDLRQDAIHVDRGRLIASSPVMGDPLCERIRRLEGDERLLVERIVERLDRGRDDYGPWHADADTRDHRAEAAEEILDTVVYLYMRLIQEER